MIANNKLHGFVVEYWFNPQKHNKITKKTHKQKGYYSNKNI